MVASHRFEPRILGFLCNWCCYAGADLAGVSRYQYPPNLRIIRLMCSGRVDPAFILRGFSNGVDGVFVGGCWLGDCHYLTQGNYDALSMMNITRKLLKYTGIDPDRLRLEWVSASEGNRFAEVITSFTNRVKELGPVGINEVEKGTELRAKLAAVNDLLPYIKLVERERLRVHFESEKEYEEYFNSDEVNRLFDELVVSQLRRREILNLLKEKPLSAGEISEQLDLETSEVSRQLNNSSKQGLVRFDEKDKLFTLV